MTKLFIVIALSALAAFAGNTGRAYAAGDSLEALRSEVEALRQTVRGLEARLSVLEGQASAPPPCQGGRGGAGPGPAAAGKGAIGTPPAEPPRPPAALAEPAPETGRPSIRQRWRQITRQMTADQIEALLGAPQKTFTAAGKIVWYYDYPGNRRGSVTFFQDMHVAGWQMPPSGSF
ncbi:MAG: hypothetical protein P8X55_10755 [Desulfosarcinaceae bacterium]